MGRDVAVTGESFGTNPGAGLDQPLSQDSTLSGQSPIHTEDNADINTVSQQPQKDGYESKQISETASNSENIVEQTLDLSKEDPQRSEKMPEPGGVYDPRPVEDSARRTIAYLLISLLWLIVAAILIMIGWQSVAIADLKEFGVLLSPIVVLVSAATGFYYGTKSNGK